MTDKDDGWREIAKIDEDSQEMQEREEVWETDAEDEERIEEVNEHNRKAAAENHDYETAKSYNPSKVGAKKAASNLKNWIKNQF